MKIIADLLDLCIKIVYLYIIITNKKPETMTTATSKKLTRALEMMRKAEQLMNEVASSDKNFKYSANATFRNNRVSAAILIVESEVKEFS